MGVSRDAGYFRNKDPRGGGIYRHIHSPPPTHMIIFSLKIIVCHS